VRDLQWQQIELSEDRLHVHRLKHGIPSVHPVRGDEMRALLSYAAITLVSERGGLISPIGFHRLIPACRRVRQLAIPTMLRHACGFKLANDGRDTRALHKNIQHTVRYGWLATGNLPLVRAVLS